MYASVDVIIFKWLLTVQIMFNAQLGNVLSHLCWTVKPRAKGKSEFLGWRLNCWMTIKVVLNTGSQYQPYILKRSLSGTRLHSPHSNNEAACLRFFTHFCLWRIVFSSQAFWQIWQIVITVCPAQTVLKILRKEKKKSIKKRRDAFRSSQVRLFSLVQLHGCSR